MYSCVLWRVGTIQSVPCLVYPKFPGIDSSKCCVWYGGMNEYYQIFRTDKWNLCGTKKQCNPSIPKWIYCLRHYINIIIHRHPLWQLMLDAGAIMLFRTIRRIYLSLFNYSSYSVRVSKSNLTNLKQKMIQLTRIIRDSHNPAVSCCLLLNV